MKDNNTSKETILNLLICGHEYAALSDKMTTISDIERAARQAIAYFQAAQTILSAFGELHNELIEHPCFISARKFSRKFLV